MILYWYEVTQIWEWMKEYSGTLVFNPAHELKEIPNHSSFFILAPDNRSESSSMIRREVNTFKG